jgi:hypothetical protein
MPVIPVGSLLTLFPGYRQYSFRCSLVRLAGTIAILDAADNLSLKEHDRVAVA